MGWRNSYRNFVGWQHFIYAISVMNSVLSDELWYYHYLLSLKFHPHGLHTKSKIKHDVGPTGTLCYISRRLDPFDNSNLQYYVVCPLK
jgi:hypothetical protein